jgi:hypothetical protein
MQAAARELISREPWFFHHPKIGQGLLTLKSATAGEPSRREGDVADISAFMLELG